MKTIKTDAFLKSAQTTNEIRARIEQAKQQQAQTEEYIKKLESAEAQSNNLEEQQENLLSGVDNQQQQKVDLDKKELAFNPNLSRGTGAGALGDQS